MLFSHYVMFIILTSKLSRTCFIEHRIASIICFKSIQKGKMINCYKNQWFHAVVNLRFNTSYSMYYKTCIVKQTPYLYALVKNFRIGYFDSKKNRCSIGSYYYSCNNRLTLEYNSQVILKIYTSVCKKKFYHRRYHYIFVYSNNSSTIH